MNLTFIILAHNQPTFLKKVIDKLSTQKANIVVHFDLRASRTVYNDLVETYSGNKNVEFISVIKGVWGKWSLVQATIEALKVIQNSSWKSDYVHLMSGVEYPIRSLDNLRGFLKENPLDFIECVDFKKTPWVRAGLEEERFQYYFPFSYQVMSKRFAICLKIQKRLKIRRKPPCGIEPRLGSQWWTLRWSTCDKLLKIIERKPQIVRYFKTTLIPDESFFQSLISHIIPLAEFSCQQLVCHELAPNGRPFTFKNNHEPLVSELDHFFIRKVSPESFQLINYIDNIEDSRDVPNLAGLKDKTKAFKQFVNNMFHSRKSFVWNNDFIQPTPEHLNSQQKLIIVYEKEHQVHTIIQALKCKFPEVSIFHRGHQKSINEPAHTLTNDVFTFSVEKKHDSIIVILLPFKAKDKIDFMKSKLNKACVFVLPELPFSKNESVSLKDIRNTLKCKYRLTNVDKILSDF